MGSSKIIMLSGVYMILGMYSVSFDTAHQSNFDLASKTAISIQAEQIARTGISLAMTRMGGNSSIHTFSSSVSVLGGHGCLFSFRNTKSIADHILGYT